MTVTSWERISDDEAASIIGEGVHTGLRKGTEAENAHDLWKAIQGCGIAWSDALRYCVWGLGEMGLAVCREVPERG